MRSTEPEEKTAKQKNVVERLGRSSFPFAAVWGAFTSFLATAFRARSEARAGSSPGNPLIQIDFPGPQSAVESPSMELDYSQTLILGASDSKRPFRRSLSGISVDASNRIYILADDKVNIFDSDGNLLRAWPVPSGAISIAVGPEERIYLGLPGKVEIYASAGIRVGNFSVGENNRPAKITAIRIIDRQILVADATARYIRRYNEKGKQVGEIGTQNKTRSFMLPNRSLDIDVDSRGIVWATDPGRHRVTSWTLEGTPAGHFGRFGLKRLEDFVGCCNPVNIAATPDGKIVTAEKITARVKVFDAAGRILALIGPENFDPLCVHLFLAVDSKGRILVADPVRLHVKVFSPRIQSGGNAHV